MSARSPSGRRSWGSITSIQPQSLNNLGMLLGSQGDYSRAQELLERALATWERALGPDHVSVATCLDNLGVLLEERGDDRGARERYERASKIFERELGPDHPETLMCLNNLANMLGDRGDYEAARPLHERVLATRMKLFLPDHPDIGQSFNNLARVFEGSGDAEQARSMYERALEIWSKVLGPGHRDTTLCTNNLATLLLDMRKANAAWELMLAKREIRVAYEEDVLESLSENERFQWLSQRIWDLEILVSIAARSKDAAKGIRAYEEVLRWKGRVGRTMRAARQRLAAADSRPQKEPIARLRACQRELSALVLESDVPDASAHETRLASVGEQRNELELELLRTLEDSPRADRVSFADIRGALPPRAALVDSLALESFRPGKREDGGGFAMGNWSDSHVFAWVSRTDRDAPVLLDLGKESRLDDLIDRYLLDLRLTQSPWRPPGAEDRAARIRDALWRPIATQLDGVELVFVSPDSALCRLPFEVIPVDGERFAIEDRSFVYLDDVASFATESREHQPVNGDSLLSVGFSGPELSDSEVGLDGWLREALRHLVQRFVQDAPGLGERTGRRPDLDPLLAEAQLVFDLHAASQGEGGRRLILTETEATEERLDLELPAHSIVHISTHGAFLRHAASELDVGPLGNRPDLLRRYPGLRAALSCAPPSAVDPGGADGVLTAEEVTWLDLSHVEIAVLSACQSGSGQEQTGEGRIGMRRAFRMAGARTVIAATWDAEILPTLELMHGFYRNLFVNDWSASHALRAAQLETLQENRLAGNPRPTTWGVFVLSGEWR